MTDLALSSQLHRELMTRSVYSLHTLYTLIITVVFMFELCIVFDCTIIFTIDMPSVFAQNIVDHKKGWPC